MRFLVCRFSATSCSPQSASPLGGVTFYVLGTAITLSGLAIAAIAGITLNAILPGKVLSIVLRKLVCS